LAGSGNAELVDVNDPDGGGFQNNQDSFFFAEVLKYCYLTFADGKSFLHHCLIGDQRYSNLHKKDADYQVKANGLNKFVFNTEAHPILIQG
jgi:mannosyl-oligosaccharide alpha-1,2-mannosidase